MADPGTENGSDALARLASVRGLNSAEDVVMQWDSNSSDHARQSKIWEGLQHESDAYLEAVDEIQTALESLTVGGNNQKELTRAQNLCQLAMTRLEEELRHLLLTCSEPIDPEWLVDNCSRAGSFNSRRLDDAEGGNDFDADVNDDVDAGVDGEVDAAERPDDEEQREDKPFSRPVGNVNPVLDFIPPATVLDLTNIVKRMIIGGYERECVQVYASIRKNVLEETLTLLGVEKLSIDEVGRMKWEDLEVKISKWNQRMKVCVRALLASEKHLCESVFANAPVSVACSCFNELGKGPMMQLLSFGEAVAISRRSPEKLFKILDMYETIRDLLPDIKDTFCGEACAPLRADVEAILARLGECAKRTFGEFEIAIQRDGSRIPVPGGGVHPLTKYVMNYIKFMCDYSDTMKLLFDEKEYDLDDEGGNESSREGSFRDGSLRDSPRYSSRSNDGERGGSTELSTLGTQTIWVTKVLLSNLEEKSKLYRDLSLTYLFLMNNIHYIVQKVKTTEVRAVVGDDWVRKNTSQVRQYASSYQRAAWGKILSCLRDEGIHTGGGFSSGVSKPVLKERFKSFNAAFEEVQKAQTSWVIQDDQLRDELRIAISDKILPAYRSFLGRYGHYMETQRHPERYIKYTSEHVEEFLNNLFEIHSPSLSSRDLRRRSSHHGSSHHGDVLGICIWR
ncbi:exocyst complex component EXO70A1 isoform X2 [Physcomitrium patens]|uniref:exocyst complex component EXO70A1 isoform X2 n=1 Tax=Physcomitrium patens TaxID=3218 RepID=UPI000D166EE1|nr:exocyst complex component EXO70A1-like isoform X2 [Physcomitrium patens]|eukprot:XP_024377993.1 exocyst complex component EXO70A1-like isoform X2 [Physcomitrella patens]